MPEGLSEAQLIERVLRLENQLRAVYERLGMEFDDGSAGVPPEVVEKARSGDRMGAAKLLTEMTGVSFVDAQRTVNSL